MTQITIYNKYSENGVEKWQRTVLEGVFWHDIKSATVRKSGITPNDTVQIIIPFNAKCTRKTFYKPKAWLALPNKANAWTLAPGDTIVNGNLNYDIVKSTRELTNDDVVIISSVDTNSAGGSMAHWEVTAK